MAGWRSSERPLEVELTLHGARNLKNVNWREGSLRAYAVAWVDPEQKRSSKVDFDNDDDPVWEDTLVIPIPRKPLDELELRIDVVHENPGEFTKPLVGSAKVPLVELLDEAGGVGERLQRTFKLKRPSGRPQGKVETTIRIREVAYAPPPPGSYYPYGQTQGYGQPQPYGVRDRGYEYGAPPPSGYPAYGAPPPQGYPAYGAPPPSGYPSYGAPPPPSGYPSYRAPPSGYPSYGAPPPPSGYGAPYQNVPAGAGYGSQQPQYGNDGSKSGSGGSKYGMGTGLAVGAAAGLLGGLAIAEGVDYAEDKFDEAVDERVEEALEEQNDDDYGGDDGW